MVLLLRGGVASRGGQLLRGALDVEGMLRLRHKGADLRGEAIDSRGAHALLVSSTRGSSSAGLALEAMSSLITRGDHIEGGLSTGPNGEGALRLEGRGSRLDLAGGLLAGRLLLAG